MAPFNSTAVSDTSIISLMKAGLVDSGLRLDAMLPGLTANLATLHLPAHRQVRNELKPSKGLCKCNVSFRLSASSWYENWIQFPTPTTHFRLLVRHFPCRRLQFGHVNHSPRCQSRLLHSYPMPTITRCLSSEWDQWIGRFEDRQERENRRLPCTLQKMVGLYTHNPLNNLKLN